MLDKKAQKKSNKIFKMIKESIKHFKLNINHKVKIKHLIKPSNHKNQRKNNFL
jgi:hypothetical protein